MKASKHLRMKKRKPWVPLSTTPSKNSMTNAELQEKREKASILYWIKNRKIKTESDRKLEFKDHRFLLDIYTDESDMLVIRKASQVGASTMQILRALHAARYWGINQIYTLPTVDDVGEFVRSKVNRIVKVNPSIMGGVSHRDVDSIEQKQIGKGFLFFKGTHTEKEAIMLSSDRNLHSDDTEFRSRPSLPAVRSETLAVQLSALWAQTAHGLGREPR